MKKTTIQFFCDRCGAEIDFGHTTEFSRRLRRIRFERIPTRIQFYKKWKPQQYEPMVSEYELCNECRASLEQWLEAPKEVKGHD